MTTHHNPNSHQAEKTMTDEQKNSEVDVTMLQRGFLREGTGGGCEAYIRWGATGSVWITAGEDPSVPDSIDDAVLVGFYPKRDHDGRAIACVTYPSLRAALDSLMLTDGIDDKAELNILRTAHRMQVLIPKGQL